MTSVASPVDLRSDTVTQPTAAMRAIMASAPVGDDVFGEDPSINALESRAAELIGTEASLFVPSGTMANQLAILAHCGRAEDVLVGEGAHSFLYEGAGGAVLAGVQFTVVGKGGHFSPEEVTAAARAMDGAAHIPPTTLLMVENTHNRGGGKVMQPEAFAAVASAARAKSLSVHIDGARLFNAGVACGVEVSAWGCNADSVSLCLSKGLGAPVGSVLCGSRDFVKRAHRYRKMLGGGMRQAGIVAAGALHALNNHINDLHADHRRARQLAEALSSLPGVQIDPAQVDTNIVIFGLDSMTPAALCASVADSVLVLPFGPKEVRAVLHRDIDDAQLERSIRALKAGLIKAAG